MTNFDKIKNYLGISKRANKVVLGEDFIIDSMRKNKLKFLFIASDIGDSTKKKILNKCEFFNIEYSQIFSREDLSNAVGKENRVMVGIVDEGIVKAIKKLL